MGELLRRALLARAARAVIVQAAENSNKVNREGYVIARNLHLAYQ